MDFETELKIGFLDEAEQAITSVEQCFLSLESNPDDAENLNMIFRLAHNLKGSSKAVGFEQFSAFTHQFESFILKIKNYELKCTAAVVNLLLKANDHVAQMVVELKKNLDAKFDSDQLMQQMANYVETETEETAVTNPDETPAPVDNSDIIEAATLIAEHKTDEAVFLDIDLSHAEETVDDKKYFEPLSKNISEMSLEEFLATFDDKKTTETQAATAADSVAPTPAHSQTGSQAVSTAEAKNPQANTAKASAGAASAAPEESIRVALSKVETLINFVGEMVILQSVLREQVGESENSILKKTMQQMNKVSKEIQDISMGLRMVPIKPTFQKMQRIVRDTALALHKDIQFQMIGEETELDKTVLEKINDPLVHLIRNSVDHGVESADVRSSRGKSPKGVVTLGAYHNAGKLILEVKDDGGGLDPEKLKRKAIEKKIIKPDAQLSEREAMHLIFAAGFSTKEQVTDVSGRGVGMDVVKTNIHELGGEILIDSQLGQGTTFKIILPLTLAIIDAMVLTYSNEKFILPLNHVHETVRPEASIIESGPLGDILKLRDENLPMYRLGDYFGIKNSTPIENMIAMIIRSTQRPFAILVDDIIGQYQVVIKQLGVEIQNIQGISGSTILGDGRPALILEPTELIKRKLTPNFVRQLHN